MHFGPATTCHTWSITHGLPFARSLIQVTDDESYAQIRDLVESSPAEFWEPIAQRELHWLHSQHCAWLKYHSDDLRCRVQINGSRLRFFDVGWLEVHRASAVGRAGHREQRADGKRVAPAAPLMDAGIDSLEAGRLVHSLCVRTGL